MEFDTYKTCGPVPCIAHGDFWINNILFKYNKEGHPVAAKVLDFQMSRIGHPASDVLYFLFTSTTSKMRKNHLRQWLRHYYETFMRDLTKLNSKITETVYTWEEFLNDYKRRSLRWMVYSGMVMGLVLNKKLADELDVMHQERGISFQFKNEKFIEHLFVLLTTGIQQQVIADETNQDVATRLTANFTSIIKTNKISKNPALASRLLELFEEVKNLNDVNYWI